MAKNKCKRCNHIWTSKTDAPVSCAKCKSKSWNKSRIYLNSTSQVKRFLPTGRKAAKYSRIENKFDYFVCGISSGKDSTALLLWILNEFKIDRKKLICTFADTGNEAPQVYKHIEKINNELHPVITLKPELDFFELAYKKKRFPDFERRFCTEQLKLEPSKKFLQTLTGKILMLNGVRADESKKRENYKEFVSMFQTYAGFDEWRPLLKWTLEDVFLIHKRYKFPLNPLYDLGFSRVGCMPCILARKEEIKLLAEHFPEKVKKIREAENNFPNNNNFYQFFPLNKTPKKFQNRTIQNNGYDTPTTTADIDGVIKWSNSIYKNKNWIEYESECKAGVCE